MSATDFGDSDHVIHIPSRDLTGTREAKLAELDTFLTQLQVVRLALCGQVFRVEDFVGAPGERRPAHRRVSWALPLTRLRTVLHGWRATGIHAIGRR